MSSVLDTSNNLFSLAEFKDFVGLASAASGEDLKYEDYINAASWYLKQGLDRVIVAQNVTEYHDGIGSDRIFLKNYPVMCVVTLHSDPDRDFDASHLMDSGDYQIYTDEGYIVVTNDAYDIGERVIKVVYRAGWDTVPYDIKIAGMEYAALLYEKYKHHRIGLTSVTDASGSRSYFAEIPKVVEKVLESYRKKVVF